MSRLALVNVFSLITAQRIMYGLGSWVYSKLTVTVSANTRDTLTIRRVIQALIHYSGLDD